MTATSPSRRRNAGRQAQFTSTYTELAQTVRSSASTDGRGRELTLIAVRFSIYLGAIFWLLPFGMAWAFLGVQLAAFGFYMGASFAPNHIGMPIIAASDRLNFLDKQVRTSRNIGGGWWMTVLMGGLNYQIEHHLFRSMPRPHLNRAGLLVREHCRAHEISYTETSLVEALAIVVRGMSDFGLAASRTFSCPRAPALGR